MSLYSMCIGFSPWRGKFALYTTGLVDQKINWLEQKCADGFCASGLLINLTFSLYFFYP